MHWKYKEISTQIKGNCLFFLEKFWEFSFEKNAFYDTYMRKALKIIFGFKYQLI